jgi:hypothetical protein
MTPDEMRILDDALHLAIAYVSETHHGEPSFRRDVVAALSDAIAITDAIIKAE